MTSPVPQNIPNHTFLDIPFVTHHSENKIGRDFVVGDLHGCRSLLETLMQHVSFNPDKDRLFSVGDLVDRGPSTTEIYRTLELLDEPWFYPVLGNHEAMFMAFVGSINNNTYRKAFLYNSGTDWVETLSTKNLQHWAIRLLEVPFVRVVGKDTENRFNIVHAERAIYAGAFLSDADIDSINRKKLTRLHYVQGYDGFGTWYDQILWGRSLRFAMQDNHQKRNPYISLTFAGHTITVAQHPGIVYEMAHHVFLDTGAYLSVENPQENAKAGLTLWDVHADIGYSLTPNGISEVKRYEAQPKKKHP